MAKQNYHVVPRDGEWAVVGEGNSRASSLHRTQADAIEAGRDHAKDNSSELRIHGRNGQIREGLSFGNDPYPPKG